MNNYIFKNIINSEIKNFLIEQEDIFRIMSYLPQGYEHNILDEKNENFNKAIGILNEILKILEQYNIQSQN